jgi:hypothetical protein
MFQVGDKVVFGRENGEKTLGTVVKVNAKSVTIRQDEERGASRVREVGTMWRVHPSLVSHASADAAPPVTAKRAEREIMLDILAMHTALSPECLYADGERSRSQARARASQLNARLAELQREIGRNVSESEAYAYVRSNPR